MGYPYPISSIEFHWISGVGGTPLALYLQNTFVNIPLWGTPGIARLYPPDSVPSIEGFGCLQIRGTPGLLRG